MIIERANKATQAGWRRVLLWARFTWVIRAIAAALFAVAALLGGGVPPPTAADLSDGAGGRPSKTLGTCRCGFAVKKSSGWVRDIQVDFTNSLASRWRGPGAIIPGIAWIGDRGLMWRPRVSGARGFELPRDDVERIQAAAVGVRSRGLVVTTNEPGEAWLLLSRNDAATLLAKLSGNSRPGGRDSE